MTRLLVAAPLLLVVAGTLVYHFGAKSIPRAYDPVAALVGVYATALIGSLAAQFVNGWRLGSFHASRMWHPTIAAVGLGALMIEMGFLLAYRSAWPVSTASVISNGMAAVLLVALGAWWFGEPVTASKILGIALCLAGVAILQF